MHLPTLNAILNGSAAILLIVAFYFIKQKNVKYHRRVMLSAFSVSTLFMISYITYHYQSVAPTEYQGNFPKFYYLILITHIFLAASIIPLALVTLYRGWNMIVDKHRNIARITLPIWLYVSVTGVIIYLMLYI